MLQDLLWTWEKLEDGTIQGQVGGQEILIYHVLIHEQLGISKDGAVVATNVTFEEAKIALWKFTSPDAFLKNE